MATLSDSRKFLFTLVVEKYLGGRHYLDTLGISVEDYVL
jgi:hypothetical protein